MVPRNFLQPGCERFHTFSKTPIGTATGEGTEDHYCPLRRYNGNVALKGWKPLVIGVHPSGNVFRRSERYLIEGRSDKEDVSGSESEPIWYHDQLIDTFLFRLARHPSRLFGARVDDRVIESGRAFSPNLFQPVSVHAEAYGGKPHIDRRKFCPGPPSPVSSQGKTAGRPLQANIDLLLWILNIHTITSLWLWFRSFCI